MTITASKLELAMKCPGSQTLPQMRERNEWSDAGNERHDAIEADVNAGDVPERIAARWPGYTWRAEVAYAYDVSTGEGRELGVGIKRDYARFNLGPFEVAGTADLVGTLEGSIVVVDWKGYEVQAPAASHPQVRFLGLAASRAHDAAHTEVVISPEVGPLDVAEMDPFDLDETAHQARRVMLDVAKAQHDARNGLPVLFAEGRQCRWCDAFHSCPKKAELRAMVVSGAADLRIESTIPLQDDKTAAEAYDFTRKLRILLKRAEAAVYARASERPIPLGDGRMFGPVEKAGNERLDGDVTHAVVAAHHGRDIADAAIEKRASKKRLKEALAFAIGKGGVAAAERTLLAEIRAKGGATQELTTTVAEYTPQPLLRVVS